MEFDTPLRVQLLEYQSSRRYAIREGQWERIKDLLPRREGTVGVTADNNRLFALCSTLSLESYLMKR